MNFYYQNYAASKTSGISKKEWEDFGVEKLLDMFRFLGIESEKDLSIFAKKFTYKECKLGEFLVVENEVCDKIYYIISGSVRFYISKEHKEITKSLLNQGNLVTSLSFIQQGKSDINIVACTKLRMLVLDANDLKLLMVQGWMNEINSLIIAIQNKGSVYAHQLSSILHLEGLDRIQQLKSLFPEVFSVFSAKNISALLGMQASTYSKLVKLLP